MSLNVILAGNPDEGREWDFEPATLKFETSNLQGIRTGPYGGNFCCIIRDLARDDRRSLLRNAASPAMRVSGQLVD